MQIFNRSNTRNTGTLKMLTSSLLVGGGNVPGAGISLQVSTVPVNSEQPLHRHEPEQCYYILAGEGLMTVDSDQARLVAGDAVHVPSNALHGIKNTGTGPLEYLTANAPAFEPEYEKRLWPEG
jgi:mannose-6-phosphate isomerase-like protein (cupin superfamily)